MTQFKNPDNKKSSLSRLGRMDEPDTFCGGLTTSILPLAIHAAASIMSARSLKWGWHPPKKEDD